MESGHDVVNLFIIGMWAKAQTTLRSMALILGALSGVSYTGIESANVYWTWLWVWVLIFWGMHAFKLQNFWDKAVERKAVPWSSPFNCCSRYGKCESKHQSLLHWPDCEGTKLDWDSCTRCLIKGRGCETWSLWEASIREIGMLHLLISHWMKTPSWLLRFLKELPLPDSNHHILVALETPACWCIKC